MWSRRGFKQFLDGVYVLDVDCASLDERKEQ
jgi:hypothetical protein